MKTQYLTLPGFCGTGKPDDHDLKSIAEAAEILQTGGLVAFPTETVYGLGGNALLPDASRRIYAAKGRPSDNPLIVHISSMEELAPLVKEIPERARILAETFWPGPLTMILPKSDLVPKETTGGLDTVAIRMPSHPVANALIRLAAVPVAAPSANTSGRPSPTTGRHVFDDLDGKIDAIVDGGAVPIGLESTIVDLSGERPVLLRPGAITIEMLSKALSEEVIPDPALERPLDPAVHPKAPGMKYRHYAPKAPMLLIQPEDKRFDGAALKRIREKTCEILDEILRVWSGAEGAESIAALRDAFPTVPLRGSTFGILCSEETEACYRERYASLEACKAVVLPLGSHRDEESAAAQLFGALRSFDEQGADVILAEGVAPDGIGYAIQNRMKKACGQQVISV